MGERGLQGRKPYNVLPSGELTSFKFVFCFCFCFLILFVALGVYDRHKRWLREATSLQTGELFIFSRELCSIELPLVI
uniref:Uncharacterized protein n=1 Tax=Sander lucioperca TaxID=283035 RepID=A0A8C9YAV5_SANLU